MLKIIISGCNGHMGRVVAALCAADSQVEVVAGLDVMGSTDREFPVYTSPAQFTGQADAVIDFSSPAALDGLQARRIRLSRAGGKCKSREHQADGDQIYGLLHDLRVVTV